MTIYNFLKSGIIFLEKKGIKDSKNDAVQIFLNAFDLTLSKYLQCQDMNMLTIDSNIKKWDVKINKYNLNLVKRVKHMPLQYILNEAFFYNLKFYVDENVLIPRQDTEVLVDSVLNDDIIKNNDVSNNKINLLDLCTGSGVIGISISKNAKINNLILADCSEEALNIAKKNVIDNNIDNTNAFYIKTDMFSNIKSFLNKYNIDKFDIITINPPYIETEVINTLDDEVKNYEPRIALDGGYDGLDYYRIIFDNVDEFLSDKGKVFIEIGYNQGNAIREMFKNYNYNNFTIINDLSKNNRVVTFTL